jgi:hypothetical protein
MSIYFPKFGMTLVTDRGKANPKARTSSQEDTINNFKQLFSGASVSIPKSTPSPEVLDGTIKLAIEFAKQYPKEEYLPVALGRSPLFF